MNDNVKVKGEVDAGWNSYLGDGETVEVTPDDAGEENFILLPDEVEDKELTERQTTIIREAVANPDCTLGDIAELEESWSPSAVRGTLLKKCPEWYEGVFNDKENHQGAGDQFLITDDEIIQMAETFNGLTASDIIEEAGMARGSALDRLNDLEERGILTHETNVDGFHVNEKVFYLADQSTGDEEMTEMEAQDMDVDEENQSVEEALDQEVGEETVEVPSSFVEDIMEFESIHAEDKNTISEIETLCEHVKKVDGEGSDLAESVLEIIQA